MSRGLDQFASDTTRPGFDESRPTRDEAWMYSAVFLGCPTTSMRPSRGTSTPTWSIDVASTKSNGLVPHSGNGFPAWRAAPRSSRYFLRPWVLHRSENGSDNLSRFTEMSSEEI